MLLLLCDTGWPGSLSTTIPPRYTFRHHYNTDYYTFIAHDESGELSRYVSPAIARIRFPLTSRHRTYNLVRYSRALLHSALIDYCNDVKMWNAADGPTSLLYATRLQRNNTVFKLHCSSRRPWEARTHGAVRILYFSSRCRWWTYTWVDQIFFLARSVRCTLQTNRSIWTFFRFRWVKYYYARNAEMKVWHFPHVRTCFAHGPAMSGASNGFDRQLILSWYIHLLTGNISKQKKPINATQLILFFIDLCATTIDQLESIQLSNVNLNNITIQRAIAK